LASVGLRRSTVRVALFVLVAVVVLSVAEVTSDGFNDFTREHALLSTFITEAILLVGVYLVIDEIIERRDARRWSDVMSLGVRALSTRAEGPAEVVRRAVDGLAGSTQVDYEEFVSARSDELAEWLLADDARARSFAEQLRRGATRLEDAIIRWGPTLIEDPESAELLNLLPDIVDSARSAADTIAPVPSLSGERVDAVPFGDSLLDILRHADEFDRSTLRAQ
jgi:hypothetical protein